MGNKMACGACGGIDFRIYLEEGSPHFPTKFNVDCIRCDSSSVIEIPAPTMKIGFSEGSQGCLCVMREQK